MVNPFDRNFFKFLTGFVLILVASFGVLYFMGMYSGSIEKQTAAGKGEVGASVEGFVESRGVAK